MKGSHSTVLLQSRSMVCSKRVYSRKNVDRNFCVGQGPLPIHIKVERRISPEAFVKKQYRIFSIFDLESLRTLAPSLRNIWIFLHLVGCSKLDNEFNPGTPPVHPR